LDRVSNRSGMTCRGRRAQAPLLDNIRTDNIMIIPPSSSPNGEFTSFRFLNHLWPVY